MKTLDTFDHAWPLPIFKVTGGHFFPCVCACVRGLWTLVRELHELQSSNSKHIFLIWSHWTSSLMHDIDLLSKSLASIRSVRAWVHLSVRGLWRLYFENGMSYSLQIQNIDSLYEALWQVHSCMTLTYFQRHWWPVCSCRSHFCVLWTLVWKWNKLQLSNWQHTFFEWRPSFIIFDVIKGQRTSTHPSLSLSVACEQYNFLDGHISHYLSMHTSA